MKKQIKMPNTPKEMYDFLAKKTLHDGETEEDFANRKIAFSKIMQEMLESHTTVPELLAPVSLLDKLIARL